MKILFTGATGFLGKNIRPILEKNYYIKTLGKCEINDYSIDLSKEIPIFNESFDIVLHAAGKAHSIPNTEKEKQDFFDVNLKGTINLCTGLEKTGIPKSFIFISSVAIYGCGSGNCITEDASLNGTSPYAVSKIKAEKYLTDWCNKHSVILGILRPSLIAGPNPPGNLGVMIKGIKSGKYLSISNGIARKSVLMVQDIANIVPLISKKGGVYNVCDSSHPSFRELEELIANQLGKSKPLSIPYKLAKVFAKVGDLLGEHSPINTLKLDKITKSLTFSNEKARKELGWTPLNVLDNFKIS